jgi:protein SCO1/2
MTMCAVASACRVALGLACAAMLALPASADNAPVDESTALARSEAALGRQLDGYEFRGERGAVALADYRGKPVVLTLVYTGCADICPMIVDNLDRAIAAGQEALGTDSFAVLTVGFDAARDTPERMGAFARDHGAAAPNWRFVSADAAAIERLSDDVGFTFYPSPKGFDHLAQTTILDGEGRIYRQVLGAEFSTPALVEPLKELVFGRRRPVASVAGLLDRIRLFCTVYDPRQGRYRFSYTIFISIFGGLAALSAVGFVLARAILRLRRREAAARR